MFVYMYTYNKYIYILEYIYIYIYVHVPLIAYRPISLFSYLGQWAQVQHSCLPGAPGVEACTESCQAGKLQMGNEGSSLQYIYAFLYIDIIYCTSPFCILPIGYCLPIDCLNGYGPRTKDRGPGSCWAGA